jgi:hypothetical protein
LFDDGRLTNFDGSFVGASTPAPVVHSWSYVGGAFAAALFGRGGAAVALAVGGAPAPALAPDGMFTFGSPAAEISVSLGSPIAALGANRHWLKHKACAIGEAALFASYSMTMYNVTTDSNTASRRPSQSMFRDTRRQQSTTKRRGGSRCPLVSLAWSPGTTAICVCEIFGTCNNSHS